MLEEYIYHGKQKLRCGYTTGACAAAAAKAAALMLLSGEKVETVEIMTPKGIGLCLDVLETEMRLPGAVKCGIRKDSGDDPDITDGIIIYAEVEKRESGIVIEGGKGIGTVTKPGLDQPVGAPAINSMPQKMIAAELKKAAGQMDYAGGFRVELSAPAGVGLAAKTLNPYMGIVNGISIIGTSGIVEPMSSKAIVDTIALEMKQRRANGDRELLLTLGNYSQTFVSGYMPDMINSAVKCSNFIGEAIDMAMTYDFERILLVGHIGKLVKLGAGIMNTHSSQADGRMEVLVTCGVLAGVQPQLLRRIADCVTVDDAISIYMAQDVWQPVLDVLLEKIQFHLDKKVKGALPIGAVLFSNQYGMLGRTRTAREW